MTAAAIGATVNTAAGKETPFLCATVAGDKITVHVAGRTVDVVAAGPPAHLAQQLADALNADPIVRRHLRGWSDGDVFTFERR
jgi:hypothetical protein